MSKHHPSRMRTKATSAAAFVFLAGAFCVPVHAADAPQNDPPQQRIDSPPPDTNMQDWWHQQGMTGDWGGVRSRWRDAGVDIFSSYQVQSADIVKGGAKQGTSTNNQVILGANFDMQKLWGIDNGIFTFAVSDQIGRAHV